MWDASAREAERDGCHDTAAHCRERAEESRATEEHGADDVSSAVEKPALSSVAYHGPLGEYVQLVAPLTEASPAAIMLSALVMLGALIGREPHATRDGARHGCNLFALLVGLSNDGKKGTAEKRARYLLKCVDPQFNARNVQSGLATGQGLTYAVRDAAELSDGVNPNSPKAKDRDLGVSDKRLLAIEPEFAQALRLKRGQENILGTTLRQAWDGSVIGSLTKRELTLATDAHISILAQITAPELKATLDVSDGENGFLNRFLFAHSERTQYLPHGGGDVPDAQLRPITDFLRPAVVEARKVGEVTMGASARPLWEQHYQELSTGLPGKLAGITARGAAHTFRVAMIFALLDTERTIERHHIEAALAVWRYSASSARYVFGDGLSPRARSALSKLDTAGDQGLSRTEIRHDVFGSNNVPASEIDRLRDELGGHVRVVLEPTNGRPREVWRHIRHALPSTPHPGNIGEMGMMRAHDGA